MKKWLVTAALICASGLAHAHHGWSSYNADDLMRIEATLQEVQYRNPHAEVVVDYDGKRWHVILAPVRRMESRGLEKGALEAGKTVQIEAYPKRDGTAEMRAERITVDGKVIELR